MDLIRRPSLSSSVSREEFSFLLCLPVVLLALVCTVSLWFVEEADTTTITSTTSTNLATDAKMSIEDPDFDGLEVVFGGTAATCLIGGLLGISAWALCRCLSGMRLYLAKVFLGSQVLEAPSAGADEETSGGGRGEPFLAQRSGEIGESIDIPELPVCAQFCERAERRPTALAASFGELRLTCGDLRRAALEAAAALREVGIREGSLVALFLPGGLSSIVAILGTWAAGGGWLPIDREAPEMRIRALLEDGRPSAVVCDETGPFLEAKLPLLCPDPSGVRLLLCSGPLGHGAGAAAAGGDGRQLLAELRLEAVAQVIYTSGSTGLPKGVVYSQRRIAFACHCFARHCRIEEGTKVLQKTPYIWAVFRHEVFPALCNGGSLVVAEPSQCRDPKQLAELVRREGVEVLVATPSILELVIEAAGGALPQLRTAVCMGEGLQREVVRRILERAGPGLSLHNFYGSTETENAFFSVPALKDPRWRLLTKRYLPAGRPQPNTSVHILEPEGLDVLPVGATGEICFGGVISDGYWQRPELTKELFVDHPRLGRIYRTGDLGIWNMELGLQVVGRTDRQVKIRGIRIELEEVEARLREAVAAAGGHEAAAVAAPAPGSSLCGGRGGVDGADSDHLTIVAFVAGIGLGGGNGRGGLDSSVVRRECSARMPPYMVPSIIQTLDALPRLPNQKVDLRMLAKMAEKAEETVQALDSLGMLRLLSRAQVEEDIWIQNQQAFWMLVVMLGHFQLNTGSPDVLGVDTGNKAWRIEMLLGHGKDMVAFILMVGLTDSRDPVGFGPRDWILSVLALLMSGPLSYVLSPGYGPLLDVFSPPTGMGVVGHGWFLYSFMFARLWLNVFHKVGMRPAVQVVVMFAASLLFPDDVFDMIPDDERMALWLDNAAFRYKGFRWSFLFMTACYLLGFHSGVHVVRWACRNAPSTGWAVAALVGASWTGFLGMSLLNSPEPLCPGGYSKFQAVYDEEHSSHLVTMHYMMHPSFWTYLALWLCEVLLFILPPLFVAIAMAYCPVHFKTMGTTSLGNYVLHPTYVGAPWTFWVQTPVLSRITSPTYGVVANVSIICMWNIAFSVFFAHTCSAWFHRSLVGLFGLLKKLSDRRRR